MKSHPLLRQKIMSVGFVSALGFPGGVQADDAAAKLAALLQDPLANISAMGTDSTASFKGGPDHDDTSYEINLQPVYSFSFPEQEFSIVARAMIPYIGVKPGTDLPRLSDDGEVDDDKGDKGDKGREWGMSDIVTQFFYSPMNQEGWKLGAGPMISWRTRTDNDLKGAGGGAGPIGVAVGQVWVFDVAVMGGHLWGFDGDFSTTIVQPMIFYNLESMSGAYIAYNNTISYDHKQKNGDGNSWTVPLGLTVGRTLDMGDGHGLDLGLGGYNLPSFGRSQGGPKWQLKLAMTWVFPR